MGPRKRSKPNPKAEVVLQGQSEIHETEAHNEAVSLPSDSKIDREEESKSGDDGSNTTPQSSKTWYGGTWPRGNKATPVTQVAKETITAASGAATEIVASARSHTPQLSVTPLKSPTVYLSRNIASSSRSLPLAATTTKLNVTSNTPDPRNSAAQEEHGLGPEDKPQSPKLPVDSEAGLKREKVEGPCPGSTAPRKKDSITEQEDEPQKDRPSDKPSDQFKSNRESVRWLKWFSKVEDPECGNAAPVEAGPTNKQVDDKGNKSPKDMASQASEDSNEPPLQRRKSDPSPVSPKVQQQPIPRSWLGLWGNATTKPKESASASTSGIDPLASQTPEAGSSNADQSVAMSSESVATPSLESVDNPRSYGWAFWSKDEAREKGDSTDKFGELAQTNSPTQSKPETAIVDKQRGVPEKVGKRERPQSMGTIEEFQKPADSEDLRKNDTGRVTAASKTISAAEVSLKAKKLPENLLLPSFKRTYSPLYRPTIIQQLSRILQLGQPTEPNHISFAQNPHRVRRALAIGVHGYFPAPFIRSVLGQPTGTSIRFANSAASAIQRWTQDQGYSCEIEKVALEGEGKISERIDLLWKLLLNWIEKIRKADFVMIACHSQGVPVAMMLVAKLIAFGCVNSAKIGICAMAGVNLGPFADYKSRWISGSAGELFDFARSDSQVSQDYEAALDVVLRFGVKIVYVGSIDDQLVSLESSTFGTVSHPYIYRAVFVDGRVHAPDFLSHLVGFALKLRNLGISDHGLIRELSTPLAGSLYGGEGHSRIYDDEAVYYLTVEHALETTLLGDIPLQIHRDNQTTSQNPYILPFAMRGLLEEGYVRTKLHGEVTELIKQFDDWKPTSKVLKDVKFRLEGVRSKL